MKRIMSIARFFIGSMVVYFGTRVFWTMHAPFVARVAGLLIAVLGFVLALRDWDK